MQHIDEVLRACHEEVREGCLDAMLNKEPLSSRASGHCTPLARNRHNKAAFFMLAILTAFMTMHSTWSL